MAVHATIGIHYNIGRSKRTEELEEACRRHAFVRVRFTMPVMVWQSDHKFIGSYENGRKCASHKLDLVRQWLPGIWHLFPL